MVFIKATFQNTVRRFTIGDGVTLGDLKAKLKEMFPELASVPAANLEIYYRDSDGDLITVSSDEELKLAEGSVGEDKTLRIAVTVTEEVKSEDDDDDDDDLFGIVGSIFGHPQPHPHHHHHYPQSSFFPQTSHFFRGFGDPFSFPTWSDRRRMMERQEERLRRQREYEEEMRKAHLENLKKLKEKAEEEKKKAAEASGTTEGKPKEVQRRRSKPVVPVFPPGWHVVPYGNWDQTVYQTPYGTRQVWGPWGYTATFGGDEDSMETEDKGEEKKEEKMEEEDPKPKDDQPKEDDPKPKE